MQKLGALTVFLIFAVPIAAFAQDHSSDEAAACTPHVFRLCQEFIPNEKNIVDCLTKKKRQLSPACYKVFSRAPSRKRTADSRRSLLREHGPE